MAQKPNPHKETPSNGHARHDPTATQPPQTAKPKDHTHSTAHAAQPRAPDAKPNNNKIITETSHLKLTIKPHKLPYKYNP